MKKVGEILREERLRQSKSLEEISQETRVRLEFLKSIESNRYDSLPDQIYVRGFISSYSKALGLKEKDVMPFYRREFEPQQKTDIRKIPIPVNMGRFKLTPGKVFMLLASLVLTGFLVLLFLQYRNFAGVPILVIDSPPDNFSTTEEVIEIVGRADPTSSVTVSGEEVVLDVTGNFRISYRLNNGLNRVKIIAETELNKQNIIEKLIEKKDADSITPSPLPTLLPE